MKGRARNDARVAKKDETLTVRVSADFKQNLVEQARRRNILLSDLVIRSIEGFLDPADNSRSLCKSIRDLVSVQERMEQREAMTLIAVESLARYVMVTGRVLTDKEFQEANNHLAHRYRNYQDEVIERMRTGGLLYQALNNVVEVAAKKAVAEDRQRERE